MRLRVLFPFLAALLVANVSLPGCGSRSDETPTTTTIDGAPPPIDAIDDQLVHPTEGLHGGHLIELGNEEYHAELLHDEDTHTVTVYLLNGAATQTIAVPLPEITLQLFRDGQFVKYSLTAVLDESDTTQAASRFEIVDADLCDTLCRGEEIRGRLHVTIDDKPYTGTIEDASHGDHEG